MFTSITQGAVVLLATAIAAVSGGVSAPVHDLRAGDVQAAVSSTSGILVEAAHSTSDAASVAIATVGAVKTSVPWDPSRDIEITLADGKTISVGLPDKEELGRPQLIDGTVAYPSSGSSSSAVRLDSSGGVQMLSVLASESAPTRYAYALRLPSGMAIEVEPAGGAVVRDSDGVVKLAVEKPWAKDANGKSVPTHYEVEGGSLVQVVEHMDNIYAYPITADPGWGAAFRATAWATWNFLQCIVGTGVPIGLGWSILANPSVAAWVASRAGALPAGAGGFSYNYISWVKRTCGVALR